METLDVYFQKGGSWEVLGRGMSSALARYLPVSLINTDCISNNPQPCSSQQTGSLSLNLGDWRISDRLPGKKVISYIVWETSRIPRPCREIISRLEHIWVPSSWQKNIFIKNGLQEDRIRIVPEGFDPDIYYPPECTSRKRTSYRFLFVGKWEVRKGIIELLTAFTREFTVDEPVELLLLAHNPFLPDFDPESTLQNTLTKLRANGYKISNLGVTSSDKMGDIYRQVDAFVLPTRSEGWGLPLLEAMACGLPCIVTGYSGLTEYASAECTYHLRPGLWPEKVRDPVFYDQSLHWGHWARPNIRHLRQLMRYVYENPAESQQVGRKAASLVHKEWTWDHAAKKALPYLRAL